MARTVIAIPADFDRFVEVVGVAGTETYPGELPSRKLGRIYHHAAKTGEDVLVGEVPQGEMMQVGHVLKAGDSLLGEPDTLGFFVGYRT